MEFSALMALAATNEKAYDEATLNLASDLFQKWHSSEIISSELIGGDTDTVSPYSETEPTQEAQEQ